jgi:hypothetical protein
LVSVFTQAPPQTRSEPVFGPVPQSQTPPVQVAAPPPTCVGQTLPHPPQFKASLLSTAQYGVVSGLLAGQTLFAVGLAGQA